MGEEAGKRAPVQINQSKVLIMLIPVTSETENKYDFLKSGKITRENWPKSLSSNSLCRMATKFTLPEGHIPLDSLIYGEKAEGECK